MKRSRRRFLKHAAGAAALPVLAAPALSSLAWATGRTRALRIVVGFAPGSAADRVARLIAPALAHQHGAAVTIDNVTGIGGNRALAAVAAAPADGQTLLMTGPSAAISASLYHRLDAEVARDLVPVAGLVEMPNVVTVGAASPIRSLADLVAIGTPVRMASAGVGSISHLAGELFRQRTGIDAVHLPVRDVSAALTDGTADAAFAPLAAVIDGIRARSLRALAVTAPESPDAVLLNVANVASLLPGYDVRTWFGLMTARDSAGIGDLSRDVTASLETVAPEIAALGGRVIGEPPAAFGARITAETRRWAAVIAAGTAAIG